MSDTLNRYKILKPAKAFGSVTDIIDNTFLAYNSARLREACNIFAKKFTSERVTVGVSCAGALTPAGIGGSCLVPLMEAGLIDWMVMTGANLYHDLHFALGQNLHIGDPALND